MTDYALVCVLYARCWACMFQQCPGGPHTWMDSEDAEAKYGTHLPTGAFLAVRHPCPCRCNAEPRTSYRWRQAQRDRRANPSVGQRMRSAYRRRNRT
jgi:hypothetical protein